VAEIVLARAVHEDVTDLVIGEVPRRPGREGRLAHRRDRQLGTVSGSAAGLEVVTVRV